METFEIAGISLDVDVMGEGPPMLYLHPEHYAHLHASFVGKLAKRWTIYAPRHPGFDGRNPPEDFRRVEDIAYLYLDLLERLGLGAVLAARARCEHGRKLGDSLREHLAGRRFHVFEHQHEAVAPVVPRDVRVGTVYIGPGVATALSGVRSQA